MRPEDQPGPAVAGPPPPPGELAWRGLPRGCGLRPPRSQVRQAWEAASLGAPLAASAASGAGDSVRTSPPLPPDAGPQTSPGFLLNRSAPRKRRKNRQAAGRGRPPPEDALRPLGCCEGRPPTPRFPRPGARGTSECPSRLIGCLPLSPHLCAVPSGGRPLQAQVLRPSRSPIWGGGAPRLPRGLHAPICWWTSAPTCPPHPRGRLPPWNLSAAHHLCPSSATTALKWAQFYLVLVVNIFRGEKKGING